MLLQQCYKLYFFFLRWTIIGYVIISWVNADPRNQIVQMIRSTCEIMFKPLRPWAAKIPGAIDWTPFLAILVLIFLERWLVPFIARLG